MAKAIITPDQDAVISEVEIAAPLDRVFQALITREQALQWGNSQFLSKEHFHGFDRNHSQPRCSGQRGPHQRTARANFRGAYRSAPGVLQWWTNDQCQIESFALEERPRLAGRIPGE
jgi:hypothetical protein